jgi:3',5'-cyclic AMP phosphodiesterase CpdA
MQFLDSRRQFLYSLAIGSPSALFTVTEDLRDPDKFMKIIHLSDTHIGKGGNAERTDLVVDDLLRRPPDEPTRCVVVHTGDLIDAATAENRLAGRARLERLQEAGFRTVLCPGNHDYGDAVEVNNDAARIFKKEFASWIFHGEQQEFPVLLRLDDDCMLIGLDSNAAELRFPHGLFAEGNLGPQQLDRLNHLLDSDAVKGKKIVLSLHHHPFYYGYSVMPDVGDGRLLKHLAARLTRPFRRMKDAYSFCQIVRDRVRLLLFGHMHEGLDCSDESAKYGIPLALDGGSTTDTERVHDRLRYRVMDLDAMTQTVRLIRLDS